MKAFLRILVAIIFMISGFVKAVDPIGFSFKLEEYFSEAVFDMPFFENLALPIAIIVSAVEFILGVLLLLKVRLKKTLIVLLLICIFFAFLTYYSAYYNVVTDCGCFGDALKLKPWWSFAKDIVLLVLIVILMFLYRKDAHYNTFLRKSGFGRIAFFVLSVIVLAVFSIAGAISEPLIDFRDYKIGTDLQAEKSKINANPSQYEVVYVLKNTKTGEEKTMNQTEYLSTNIWEDEAWKIESDKTKEVLTKKGYDSNIKNFKISDKNGEDITDQVLLEPHILILFTYKPESLKRPQIEELEDKMAKINYPVLGVSTQEGTFTKIPHGAMDGTAIKTIARSNPFVLELKNGKIVSKQSAKEYFSKN